MSEPAHIRPEFRHVLALSDQERLRFLDAPQWIGYPVATRIIETLRGLMEKPVQPRMQSLLIVGEPFNGKTTILHRFRELYGEPYANEDAEPVKPVVIAEAPPTANEKDLYVAILSEFQIPYRTTDSNTTLRAQVVNLMRYCRVRLLAIDEMHSLLVGSTVKQRAVMNAIKYLCNTLMIPIVGVGTGDAVRVLHTDPQHASRFDVMRLPLWKRDHDFQALLRQFERVLPLKKPSNLAARELAIPLLDISQGNLGNLRRLLVECAKSAISEGAERIDAPLVMKHKWVRPTRGERELVP